MEGEKIDNIGRNIINEVLRECRHLRIRASQEFIAYYLETLRLDPNQNIRSEMFTNREDVLKVVERMVKNIAHQNPNMSSLRLQFEFKTYLRNMDKTVQKYRQDLLKYLYSMLVDITEQIHIGSVEDMYKKICMYCTLVSGLGNPAEKPVFKEALQVLKSIFETEEIKAFPYIQNYIKQELLQSITEIMTGIRLYNKFCGRGGEGMADLPRLLESAIKAVQGELNLFKSLATMKAKYLTIDVQKNIFLVKNWQGEWHIEVKFKNQAEKESWEFKRNMANCFRQLSKTTKALLETVSKLEDRRKEQEQRMLEIFEELQRIVAPRLYQAVENVFPQFVELARLWKGLQDDGVRLRLIFDFAKEQSMLVFNIKVDVSYDDKPESFLEWREQFDEELITDVDNPHIKVHVDTERFTKKDLQFHGYCCWVITHTNGVLIPAAIELGVVEYKNEYYGFFSKMAANWFCRNPEMYIMSTLNLARQYLNLVHFLDIFDKLKALEHVKVLWEKEKKRTVPTADNETQTDTHILKSNIDYSYRWNIWDYKRAALKNNDIIKKRTVFTDTVQTHQKISDHAQTYGNADMSTQCRTENYTNTMKPLRFIHGLRGKRANYPFVVDLTEPLCCDDAPVEFRVKNCINKRKC